MRRDVAESIKVAGHKTFKTNNGITYQKLDLIGPQFQRYYGSKTPKDVVNVSVTVDYGMRALSRRDVYRIYCSINSNSQ